MSDNTLSPALTARLLTLAGVAVTACDVAGRAELSDAPDAKEWVIAAQDACEDFFELANVQLSDEEDEDLTERCRKATPQEQIQHTLDVLGLSEVQP